MAYSLGSLVENLQQILKPNEHQRWVLDQHKTPQIKTLTDKASSLLNHLSNSANHDALEDLIRDAAEKAEDILDSHITERMHASRGRSKFTISPPDLQKVIDQFEYALEEIKIQKKDKKVSLAASSLRRNPNPNKVVGVGFANETKELMARLIQHSLDRQIIPIVGMGGIGKTTLVQTIFDKCSVDKSIFDTCAWATVSEDYSPGRVMRQLLCCITGMPQTEMLGWPNNRLTLTLFQSLKSRRYLIVLDDIWSVEPWNDLNNFFPRDKERSRIILTAREARVAKQVDPLSSHHIMRPLDEKDSWDVLKNEVYGEETCPKELENVGRRIAKNCRGLPLAVRVIGGLLLEEERSQIVWEKIAKDVTSTIANNDEHYSRIFSLSYSHLPHHLKPCFLYMGAFPEDHEIRASKLVMLWVAEGFLRPIKDKTLEEAAEKYIETLVDRNLIQQQQGSNDSIKTYRIHDLLRDMCLRKAHEKKFLVVKSRKSRIHTEETACLRRIIIHSSFRMRELHLSEDRMPLSRSFLCLAPASRAILSPMFFGLSLLKVLDVLEMEEFRQFPNEILQLLNLRYLAFACGSDLPEYLSVLENLQVLIVRLISSFTEYPSCTSEIFDMAQLRHVKFIGRVPVYNFEGRKSLVQKNLHSFSNIAISEVQMILETIPNLRKLGIFFDISPSKVTDLTCLDKLETLKCFADLSSDIDTYLSYIIYPDSLKRLSLRNCFINQRSMDIICQLPKLEILKLQNNAFEGSTWDSSEAGFPYLRYLLLEKLNLSSWPVDTIHFPKLQHLVIRDCSDLQEIPSEVGEIVTLEIIEVDDSSSSIKASAMNIMEEQKDMANYIEVRIRPVRHSNKFVPMSKISSFV